MNRNVIGIIPAAGQGRRLYPFPCPKELFPVGYGDFVVDGRRVKRPKVVSQYLVDQMVEAGAERLFIVIGDGKHDICRYYGSGETFGVDIAYLYQTRLAGMPYAIDLAQPWIGDATILFGMPDTIIEPRDAYRRLLEFYRRTDAELAIGLFATSTPSKFGMVRVRENGDVVETVDKPAQTDLRHMWGNACWGKRFTDLIRAHLARGPFPKEVVLGDIFNLALEQRLRFKGLVFEEGRYIDIGTTEELDDALRLFHL